MHSNGYTLVRRIIEQAGLGLGEMAVRAGPFMAAFDIFEINLTEEEQTMLDRSIEHVQELTEATRKFL